MLLAAIDIADAPTCFDRDRDEALFDQECFDGSDKRRIVTLAFAFPSIVAAIAAVVLAGAFVVRGRGWQRALIAFGVAAVLFGLSVLVQHI